MSPQVFLRISVLQRFCINVEFPTRRI